jgi:hypothetical protein
MIRRLFNRLRWQAGRRAKGVSSFNESWPFAAIRATNLKCGL